MIPRSTVEERKALPLATGLLDYFPEALLAVAEVSRIGNEQHHPGQPLHWDKSKSTDEADALLRHLLDRGKRDTDGTRHSAKVAWRALALLQRELDAEEEFLAKVDAEMAAISSWSCDWVYTGVHDPRCDSQVLGVMGSAPTDSEEGQRIMAENAALNEASIIVKKDFAGTVTQEDIDRWIDTFWESRRSALRYRVALPKPRITYRGMDLSEGHDVTAQVDLRGQWPPDTRVEGLLLCCGQTEHSLDCPQWR